MKTKTNAFLDRIKKILWAAFLVSLPVTNFRYFPGALGGTKVQVRPLLVIPMAVLLLFILPGLWKRKLPRFFLPVIAFFFLALVSNALPLISGYSSQLAEATLSSRLLRTMITLLLGLAVYVTVSLTPENREQLDFSLKWLFIGMVISLIWGSLQIIYVVDLIPGYYQFFAMLQKHITINVGSPDRIMGLTLEPSWFADQITALWLPWVLSAAIRDRTVFKKRWGWITVERILLVWMLAVLVFTLSRAGFVVAAVVLGFGFLFFRKKQDLGTVLERVAGSVGPLRKVCLRIPRPVRTIVIFAIVVFASGVFIFKVGMQNPYIKRMWLYWAAYPSLVDAVGPRSLGGFFRYIGFGPRFVYWETAYRIFQAHPLFGVGLGNYAFHFLDSLPPVQVGYMPELLTRIVPDYVRVTTAKNYLARLLAETGLLGTGAYLTYLITLILGGGYLWLSEDPEKKFWGAGALLGMIAFLIDSFSYDSLAIPNPWVVFGLITAAFSVYSSQRIEEESHS